MSYIKDINALENNNDLIGALSLLDQALADEAMEGMAEILQMNVDRIMQKIKLKTSDYLYSIEEVFVTSKNPNTYVNDMAGCDSKDLLPIISLTTISLRMNRIIQTIECIKKQTYQVHSINLYISDEPYLLDEGITNDNVYLKQLAELGVNIYNVKNIGPYRKQYPIIFQLKNSNAPKDTPIITIDDDVLYPENIVERLMKHPDSLKAVVSHRGRLMLLAEKKIDDYGKFIPPIKHLDYLNLGTGKNGILYRLGFFSNHPSEYIGPVVAPTADDLWCKWVTALKCIPTVIVEPKAAYEPSLDFKETAPDEKIGLFHKFNAKGKNDIAIANLETYFSKVGYNLFSIYSWKNN